MAVADHIASSSEHSIATLLNRDAVLIPEETKHIYTRWYRSMAHQLRRRVDPGILRTMDPRESRDLLEKATKRSPLQSISWPPMALSEEESVAGIRRSPRPGHRPTRDVPIPITKCPDMLRLEGASADMEEAMMCISGGRVVNQVYEVMIHLIDVFRRADDGAFSLYTVGDRNGTIYSLVGHMLRGKISSGFPYWKMTQSSAQSALETGPSCVTGDPCSIPYSHNGFLANVRREGPLRREGDADCIDL